MKTNLAEAPPVTNQLLSDDLFRSALDEIAKAPIFADIDDWEIAANPWCRPIRPGSFKYFKFGPTTPANHLEYAAFTTNRLLTALNELDFLFLPERKLDPKDSFDQFYSEELRSCASVVAPRLADYALDFVDQEVTVEGGWTKPRFEDYFTQRIVPLKHELPRSLSLVTASKYPEQAAQLLLMQHAVDFLTEASLMARYSLGDYGNLQSHLFKVLLDEFGYGVHDTKHSTMFKRTLESVGLRSNSHAYWQFYLNTTLLLNNYFHRITSRPRHFFRYLGAITLAENTFAGYCEGAARTLRNVYGDRADVRYYKEHAHIDVHHGRMTYQDLALAAIDRHGEEIIPEIVLGMEQTLFLQELAERDLVAQLEWMSKKDDYHELGMEIRDRVLADEANLPVARLIEPRGYLSVTHVHNGDELCVVDRGVLRFCSGPNSFVDLNAGEAVVIRRHRLHGAVPLSEICHYNIFSIGDYRRYADRDV
jgi:Iron-containing redox enzyme